MQTTEWVAAWDPIMKGIESHDQLDPQTAQSFGTQIGGLLAEQPEIVEGVFQDPTFLRLATERGLVTEGSRS